MGWDTIFKQLTGYRKETSYKLCRMITASQEISWEINALGGVGIYLQEKLTCWLFIWRLSRCAVLCFFFFWKLWELTCKRMCTISHLPVSTLRQLDRNAIAINIENSVCPVLLEYMIDWLKPGLVEHHLVHVGFHYRYGLHMANFLRCNSIITIDHHSNNGDVHL